jgi:hypothetical protein
MEQNLFADLAFVPMAPRQYNDGYNREEEIARNRSLRENAMTGVISMIDAFSPLVDEECTSTVFETDDENRYPELDPIQMMFMFDADVWSCRICVAARDTLGDIDANYWVPAVLPETSLLSYAAEFMRNNIAITDVETEFTRGSDYPTVVCNIVHLVTAMRTYPEVAALVPDDIMQMCTAMENSRLYANPPCAYKLHHNRPQYVLK